MKYKFLAWIAAASLLLGGCSATNTENPSDLVENPSFDTEVEVSEPEELTAEELHEPTTYKQFLETYYGEVPEIVGKIIVFLECSRENKDATFSERYFSYFEYENMEDVLSDYYDILGCSYTEEQLSSIVSFYKENTSWQQLCQDMYDGLISSGNENLSLIMDVISVQINKEGQVYKLVPYEYQKEMSGSDWFSLETNEGYSTLYANNAEMTFYKLVYAEDETVYSYFVAFPKSSFLVNNGYGIVVKGGGNFICMSSKMVYDDIKKLCATTHLYAVEGEMSKKELAAYENWLKETNRYAEQTDELVFYQEFVDNSELKFPLYVKDNRLYQSDDYLHLFPITARVDDEGLATEYGLCIQDLFVNANK